MKNFIKFIVLASFFICNAAQAALFDLQEQTLENGLRVLVVENHRAPIAAQVLLYRAGAVDEPLNKGGVAHLLEHLMFRGTQKVPDSGYNQIMFENGAEDNAFTTRDITGYHQVADITRLELLMALEADRMQNLNFSDEAFEKERQIVFEEREQRVSNSPIARFGEDFNKFFWNNHPYAKPVTGTEEEIKNLSARDVYDFYGKHYAPNNAVLVLSGDIELQTAWTLAQKYYASAERKELKPQVKAEKPSADVSSQLKLEQVKKEIATPRFIKKYRVPSVLEDADLGYALMVLASYLGKGENSFLNRELVLTGKMVAADVSYDALAKLGGSFSITTLPVDVHKADELVQKTLQKACEKFNEKTLENEKSKMLAGLVYVRDNPLETAMLVGTLAAAGMSAEEIENYDQNIKNVSLKTIKKACETLQTSPQIGVGHLLAGEKQ